ncbi:hypothetical protein RFI_39317 [Reticulomyxa filosa]|uniref:VLIG-type G domain-containing protein n=1 Tax=Reticulomyxa filosa TaxID=46433 RepID=X6LAN0_RETFI|nr:hypothetical protein RFI_39317 [Reticulomyxa filosa]|eukprot:ETN98196.1 hypothetical protein RFI_39317 [Reticulomyxa filosa]
MEDMLSSEKSEEYLSMGIYAIMNLKDSFLKLNKTPKELEMMYKSSNVDIVLFFWPDIDSFTDIKRGNSSSLFLRVLLEVCSTVCIKVSQSELDNFYMDKQTVQDKTDEKEKEKENEKEEEEGEQSMGSGIQVGVKKEQKINVSCNVEKMQSFSIEKEIKQDSSNGSVTSERAFAIEGARSTILCHCSIREHVTESRTLQFVYSSEEELINYIRQITKTYRLKLWSETFDTWEKTSIFAKAIYPELIEVPKFSIEFKFNKQLRLIEESYDKLMNAAHSTAQGLYDSQMLNLETAYNKFFAYKCMDSDLEEIKKKARELSDEKINNFFLNNSPFSKIDFDNGVKVLTQCDANMQWDPNEISCHPHWNNYIEKLDHAIKRLYNEYKEQSHQVRESVNQQFKMERRKKKEQPQIPEFYWAALKHRKSELQLMEEEDRQEIENRIAGYDYTPFQIEFIARFGQTYIRFKQVFYKIKQIKSVSTQEAELKDKYINNRSKQELELNKTFLQKLDERMDNGNSLSCVIETHHNNELKGSIEIRLKPIQHLTFSSGDFTTSYSDSNNLELKQAMQAGNEIDICGNEQLVFAYGLANNKIVLVLSIDNNVSDSLSVHEESSKEGKDKYCDDDKHASKQNLWSEQYNQNCITKIFFSSRQMLNKKNAVKELQGKITLAALSEQQQLMVLYERARQLIHVYKWNERITDSLPQSIFGLFLKDPLPLYKTINLRERVSPDGFYVTSMCFDSKDDNLYILDNANTIHCIALDTGLFNHEREMGCKEQYSKMLMPLKGGYIEQEKEEEEEEEEEEEIKEEIIKKEEKSYIKCNAIQSKFQTEKKKIQKPITDTTIIPLMKRTSTGLVQCDLYALNDSKGLVCSLVLPKEFTSSGISNIQFKVILGQQIHLVSLDNRFILHCLPLHVSLKKFQLHFKLTSTNEGMQTKKPSKLDYIEYSLDKFGSKPEFYSQSKLTFHLSVLLDAGKDKSLSSSSSFSWTSITQASELVLHACDKVKQDTKKIFTHLDWQCESIVIDATNKQTYLKDVLKLVKNHSPSKSGADFIRQLIMQFPMQIARASSGEFALFHNGENDPAHYAHCTTNGSFVECIQFGGYDALINSWPGKIRVVSSMGKQSTGKSYMLNHLLGCKFDISGARRTDGVWITARIVGDILYVILNFEGLGSFERSPQEDALLSVFNASISNCTIFKCENRFDQDIAKMFERFQNGVQFLRDDNDKLFKGRLLIVIKDILPADTKQVISEFSKKIASFCQDCTDKNGESESFVMQMYKDPTNIYIEPYPPLMHDSFFKKFSVLRRSIEDLPITHGDGGIPFLRRMKAIMAKLAMKDWNSNLSEQILESAVEMVQQYTESVISFGTLTISETFESLERFDVNADMEVMGLTKKEKIIVQNSDVTDSLLQKLEHICSQNNEQLKEIATEQINQLKKWKQGFEKILDNIPNGGLNLAHDNILKFLHREFVRQIPECKRSHSTHRQWFIAFQLLLKSICLRRELILEKWIANELNGLGFQTLRGNTNVQEQKIDTTDKRARHSENEVVSKFVNPFINNVLNQLQPMENVLMLCGAKCRHCHFSCLLPQSHQQSTSEAGHDCMGSHQCDQVCSHCERSGLETKEESLPCQLQAGHESFHDCYVKNHTCGKNCSLKKYGNCYENCGLEFGHSSETACMCNSPIHYCNENCSLSGCPNKCEIDYAKEHARHECFEKRCTKRCEMSGCGTLCIRVFFLKKKRIHKYLHIFFFFFCIK